MRRIEALEAIYEDICDCVVVTIMGAVAAELYSLGHRKNFFYLEHAMGLASSMGLGIALSRPDLRVVVLDGDGSALMNLGTFTTLARYAPPNLLHIVFDNESLLSVGGFPTATSTGSDLAGIARSAGVKNVETFRDAEDLHGSVRGALAREELSCLVAKVEAIGPKSFHMDVTLLENRFEFARYFKTLGPSGRPVGGEVTMTASRTSILGNLVDALARGSIRVVDLTQPLTAETPIIPLPPQWPNTPRFSLHEISRYDDRGPFWYWNRFETGEHTGTHFDAPIHWVSGRDLPNGSVDLIPPAQFIGPACVIDVTADCERDPDFLLSPDRVRAWEDEHGQIPTGAWLLLRTGWSRRTDEASYLNLDEDGPHTPGWTCDCSLFLAEERDVLGVGVETVGTDAGKAAFFDTPFCNHNTMHGHGKFGLASLCNLDLLPAAGSVVIAAPLKIVDGSGSPMRALALVED